jgi:hypothetical protein
MIAGSQGGGRYRWRTWLRRKLPYRLAIRVPKGGRDCGKHDWYNSDNLVDHCYHCAVGVRTRLGTDGSRGPYDDEAEDEEVLDGSDQ